MARELPLLHSLVDLGREILAFALIDAKLGVGGITAGAVPR